MVCRTFILIDDSGTGRNSKPPSAMWRRDFRSNVGDAFTRVLGGDQAYRGCLARLLEQVGKGPVAPAAHLSRAEVLIEKGEAPVAQIK